MYGDCCFDRAKANIPNKDSIFRSTWQCKKFTSQDHVYMISSCPSSYDDQRDIKSRCEGYSSLHTYHMDLPVEMKSKGQITYSNIFCALCNGETLENVKPFWGDVSCNNLDIIDTCGISIKEQILQAPY